MGACWPGEPGGRLVAGRFRPRSLLGRGGMGRVWLADDELLDRPVAVKQLLLHGFASAEMRAQACASAIREARAAARSTISEPSGSTTSSRRKAGPGS